MGSWLSSLFRSHFKPPDIVNIIVAETKQSKDLDWQERFEQLANDPEFLHRMFSRLAVFPDLLIYQSPVVENSSQKNPLDKSSIIVHFDAANDLSAKVDSQLPSDVYYHMFVCTNVHEASVIKNDASRTTITLTKSVDDNPPAQAQANPNDCVVNINSTAIQTHPVTKQGDNEIIINGKVVATHAPAHAPVGQTHFGPRFDHLIIEDGSQQIVHSNISLVQVKQLVDQLLAQQFTRVTRNDWDSSFPEDL